jgi:hypothetical protein
MTTPNISINPDTGVRYYDEPGHPLNEQSVDKFVAIRDDQILHAGMPWPMINGLPQPDAYLRLYLKTEPKIRVHDTRVFYVTSDWEPVDYPEADLKVGGPVGTYEETLTEHRHSEEDLMNQVEAQLTQANAQLYPSYADPMQNLLYEEAVNAKARGEATPVMLELLSHRKAITDAGMENMERAAELRKDIKAGRPFDLSAGWTYGIPQ